MVRSSPRNAYRNTNTASTTIVSEVSRANRPSVAIFVTGTFGSFRAFRMSDELIPMIAPSTNTRHSFAISNGI